MVRAAAMMVPRHSPGPRARAVRAAIAIAAAAISLTAAPAASAATVNKCNVPIRMSDGVLLRANVLLPADRGRFPLVLTATGYNKDAANPTGDRCDASGGLAGPNLALLDAGYAVMVLDDRGTGASQGTWDSWGRRSQEDYREVLDWIQARRWSNGRVATTGTSYMGITSLLIAEADAKRVAAGKPRAVRAVWANVPMADAYRDVTFHGGAVDAGFIPLWLGLVNALSDLPPSTTTSDPGDAGPTYAGHVTGNAAFAGSKIASATLGEDAAYDGPFYRLRSPVTLIRSIKVPVAWTGGWWDLFQRGEPLLYERLVNSPNRKFWMTPRYHVTDDSAIWAQQGYGSQDAVTEKWFDHWLKGKRNGVQNLPPVNLYTMGADRWQHRSRWPLAGTSYTPYYLSGAKSGSAQSINDGSLGTAPPSAGGADAAPLLPASSPCSRMSAQWTAGAASGPCETDNRSYDAGSLTYTTPPLRRNTQVTGLVSAKVWAELTSADATLVATLNDVDPSGKSTEVSGGFLLASQRAVDRARSTKGPNGIIVRPWHPYTKASQQPVVPNEANLYRIEIYPTSNVFRKGHRIRLVIGTANTPGTATPLPDTVNEAGGQIRLLHGRRYPSSLLLPLIGAR